MNQFGICVLTKNNVFLRGDCFGATAQTLGIQAKNCRILCKVFLVLIAKRVKNLRVALFGGGATAIEVGFHAIFCFIYTLLRAVKAVKANEIECISNQSGFDLVIQLRVARQRWRQVYFEQPWLQVRINHNVVAKELKAVGSVYAGFFGGLKNVAFTSYKRL